MNWFQRYGIPGVYFIGLMAGWVYAFYPDSKGFLVHNPNLSTAVALAALTFLPVGYVISIFSQFLYLILPCLGVHRAAVREANVFQDRPNNERFLEPHSLLLSALKPGITVSTHQYIRDWIARRADVMAINGSLIIATFLLLVVAMIAVRLCPELSFGFILRVEGVVFWVSLAILAIMCLSYCVLRKQVIKVIAGVYRQYKRWNIL